MYFLFQLKHKEQVEGEQNRGENTSSFTGCTNILNADHGNDDKYSYKLGDISRFEFRTNVRTYIRRARLSNLWLEEIHSLFDFLSIF